MMIHANKLHTIPVADKPLHLGGQIKRLTQEEFKQQFGSDYDEKIELESPHLRFAGFRESIEGRSTSSELRAQLERIIQTPRTDLVLCKINDAVGFGVFTMQDIPKETVLCFYSGEIIKANKVARDDHAMEIYGGNAAVSTQHYRGISSFFQHLPGVPPVPDIDLLLQILQMSGQSVSKDALLLDEELFSIEFINSKVRQSLAIANIRREYILYNGIPVILLVTNQPVKAGEQLGLKYGKFLLSRGIVPELFDRDGAIIPHTQYLRTFWTLDFEGCSYTGDLKPLVEQIKRKAAWVDFKDDAKIDRRLASSTVAEALIKVNALSNDAYQAISCATAISQTSQALFSDAKIQRLVKKYKLPDTTQKSFEKGLRNAAANNFIEDVQVLLNIVQNTNAVDENPTSRRTALIHAARNGHQACYELLLEHGAQQDIRDADGYTAQQYLDLFLDAEATAELLTRFDK